MPVSPQQRRPAGPRRVAAALAVVTVAATGCTTGRDGGVLETLGEALGFFDQSQEAGQLTCGDYLDQDEDERRDTVVDLIVESEDDAAQDALDDVEGAQRDAFLDGIAEFLVTQCESPGEDGTEIGELVYEDF